MKGRNLTEHVALKSLYKKRVEISEKNIYIKEEGHGLGNKSWGMVDFLIHYCGYFAYYVNNKREVVRMIKHQITI